MSKTYRNTKDVKGNKKAKQAATRKRKLANATRREKARGYTISEGGGAGTNRF